MRNRISRIFVLNFLAIIASSTVAIVAPEKASAAGSKPNFLFIFSDDQSHETIRHLGNKEIITPNLDRLAQNGVSFTNAYNMGAWLGAVCVASRTSLNTGRSVWQARQIERNLDQHVQRGEFWSQIMSRSGYETYLSGKWHVATNAAPLFDHSSNIRGGMPDQTEEGYNRPKENDSWTPWAKQFGGFWKGGKHWSEVLADDAERFFEKAKKADKPFFMYLAFNAPHDPRQAPREFVDLYDRDSIAVPESFIPEYPYKQEMGCYIDPKGKIRRDERLGPFPRTPETVQLHRQEYFAAITHMDAQIGRILDALENSGQADNTYIFYTSDHGLACGHHGLLGKQNMYEHSMKPPLIVSGPSIQKNQTRDALVYLQDIMPTTLELADAQIPDYVDFHSLTPIIENKDASSPYNAIYGCYQDELQRMIRVGNHKLILYPTAGIYRLYDLVNDPQELHDLAPLGGEHAEKSKELFQSLLTLQEELGDSLDLKAVFPNLSSS